MDEATRDQLCAGLEALLRELHPAGAALDLAPALAEFAASLAVIDDPDSHDLEDRSQGSLTRADALRIRASKFVAANLPPGMFAVMGVRRRVQATIRALAQAALGAAAGTSRYLDRPGRDDAG